LSTQAVFFDFDGLLVDTEYATLRAWQLTFADFGQEFDSNSWLAAVGFGAESYDPSETLELACGPIDWDAVNGKRRAIRDSLCLAMPGAIDRTEEARRLGIKTLIVSNSTPEWIQRQMTLSRIPEHLIDIVVCGSGEYPPKPDPALFLHALEAAGMPAARVITFEDSVPGVTAAKAAGLYCVAVPNRVTRGGDFSAADRVVSSMADVTLEELGAKLDSGWVPGPGSRR
jgi:HAD superfamily hydrolase (TIGR01509 family)